MKNRTYNWAVINSKSGMLMRESNGRRAIYPTRARARMAAKMLGGKVATRRGPNVNSFSFVTPTS